MAMTKGSTVGARYDDIYGMDPRKTMGAVVTEDNQRLLSRFADPPPPPLPPAGDSSLGKF